MEASDLGTPSKCTFTLLHARLSRWQDRCYHASCKLCSNYL